MKKKKNRIRYGAIFWNITKKSKILYMFALFLILYFVFTAVIFYADRDAFQHFGDALWFTFISMFTVGYGDYTVKTAISRIFTVILIIYAAVIIAIFTAIWANMVSEVIKNSYTKENEDKRDKLCNLENLTKKELAELSEVFKARFNRADQLQKIHGNHKNKK